VRTEAGLPAVRVIRLACANCGRQFAIAEQAYTLCCGVVECPACGSLDLVLLEDERAGSSGERAADTAACD
jgi:DNA-directed RNA polymerase subunit RPC12/RpoP